MQNSDFEIKNGVLIDYKGEGGNVVIPDGVWKIDWFAFDGCKGLTSVHIPDSVTKIGRRAFCGCSNLSSINIPDSVTVIGIRAFSCCYGLTSINIPYSVKEIGDYAFEYCHCLTSVHIPDSVTKIGFRTFACCYGLTSINIPDSVKEIGDYAFYGCNGLTSINISDGVTKIGEGAFGGMNIKRQPHGHIAYKGFNVDMTCRDFQYEEGKTYVCDEAKLCECGFHACLNPLDCFIYYSGDNVVYHEVILEYRSDDVNDDDSKVCGRKITIGRRLTLKEMISIFNKLNN